MEVHNVDLTISAVRPDQYPKTNYPEVALVGRSNVGKSSLTNVLINRRNFAHTSSQPGKTQTLNFYAVEDQLYFVDVPGYGYAKVSKKERERFGQMIEQYLTQRNQLRAQFYWLMDGTHRQRMMLVCTNGCSTTIFRPWWWLPRSIRSRGIPGTARKV